MRTRRLTIFTDAFDAVSSCIGHIYRRLTVSKRHPMGGQATLSLLNREEPFSGETEGVGVRYSVAPPGKRHSEIAVLSGERVDMCAARERQTMER